VEHRPAGRNHCVGSTIRIHAIVNGTRAVTADTDMRLCKFFRLSERYLLRLQNAFDTLEAKRRVATDIARIKPYKTAA
jgi:addiction module HigA family antidote